jgi:deoxyadenosine/deoxycytidine kinase
MHLRSFVLEPLAEIAGDLVHPTLKEPISTLADRLGGGDYVIDAQVPQLISIAGVIGVGKTTLASGLVQSLSGVMKREAYDTNPYIADACAGDSDAALNSQLHFLISRLEQLDKKTMASGEIFIADYVFEKDRVFAERTLSPDQMIFYNERSQRVVKSIASPVLVIYMTDSADAVLERIHARNRPYEQQIQPGSIEELSECYEKLFAGWDKCPVIRVSVSDFDPRKQENVEQLTNEIKHYIFNVHEKKGTTVRLSSRQANEHQ